MSCVHTPTKLLLSSLFTAAILAGCGGGGGNGSRSGGSIPPGSSPSAAPSVSAHFHVDVNSGQVTVVKSTANPSSRTIFTGTTVGFNSSTLYNLPGNVGTRQLSVSITNNSGLTIGSDPNGNANGINAVFSNFVNLGTFPDVRPLTNVSTVANGFRNAYGVVSAGNGVLYVADTFHNQIRKVSNGVVSVLAGTGVAGETDGPSTVATFNVPIGIAINPVDGTLIVADGTGNKIRRVTLSGQVSTIAGTGSAGALNSNGTNSSFSFPWGVAVDPSGNIFVAEDLNHDVRQITLTGSNPALASSYAVTTLAGGTAGFSDGTGTGARFNQCFGIAYMNGNLYVADNGSNAIRQVTPTGVVTTIAGTGSVGTVDGAGNVATLSHPFGITAVNGALVVSEGSTSGAMNIRQVTPIPGASQTTSAGWQTATLAGTGVQGSADGTGSVATFSSPELLTSDKSGNIYLADSGNSSVREISPNNGVFPVGAPSGGSPGTELVQLTNGTGSINAPSNTSTLPYINYPGALANGATSPAQNWWFVVPAGVNAFEFDVTVQSSTQGLIGTGGQTGHGDASEIVSTLAGSINYSGFLNGPGTSARFWEPDGICVDKFGEVLVCDLQNASIRLISPNGTVSTIAGGRSRAVADGPGNTAGLVFPLSVVASQDGNSFFFGDSSSLRMGVFVSGDRSVASNWRIYTIAGSLTATGNANGSGSVARFQSVAGVALASPQELFVTDSTSNIIRHIQSSGGDLTNPLNWTVTNFAGSGSGGNGFVNGFGNTALFNHPAGICVDHGGNLYVADTYNNVIRKITPDTAVTTFAGTSTAGYGDGTSPLFNEPWGLAIDAGGYLYAGDYGNQCIRRVSPSGLTTTIAGAVGSSAVVDGPGNVATIGLSLGIAIAPSGEIYFSDYGYSGGGCIRLIQKQISVGVN